MKHHVDDYLRTADFPDQYMILHRVQNPCCPDTITHITVAKTLVIANPGFVPWISQANIYSPNRRCPSDSPPSESFWACDSPLFSSLQPQLQESILQWVPKTRVSAPNPGPFIFSQWSYCRPGNGGRTCYIAAGPWGEGRGGSDGGSGEMWSETLY